MKLYTKIMLLNIAVVFFAVMSLVPFVSINIAGNLHEKAEINIMNTAKTISNSYTIRQALKEGDPDGVIAEIVSNIHGSVEEIQFIVVADMNSVRFAHPDSEKIGQKFVGGDELQVVTHGDSYISEGIGTLGRSLRAFVPIYDISGKDQIGFVSVGTLNESINRAQRLAIINVIFIAFIGLIIGAIGTFLLTKNIKKNLFGLEPEEISKLYHEKDSMLQAIHEGIVAIDINGNINMLNDSAMEILQLREKYNAVNLTGLPIKDVFENTQLPEILLSGKAEYNSEQMVNNTLIVTNRVPIISDNQIIGAIATFNDKTQVTQLAEEITGVNQIVAALRANTHEFMNKLHVILGLIQLEKYSDAKTYILQTSENQKMILTNVIKRIEDPTIAGLIIGKISRAKELVIPFTIDEQSWLSHNRARNIPSHVLVTIVGNLLENAFEAVDRSDNQSNSVYLKIEESAHAITIIVKDSGIGLNDEQITKVFQRGYTTKPNSKGVGLHLVKKNIESCNGWIDVQSHPHNGSVFQVTLPLTEQRSSL